jgi:hypothetical protein
MPTSPRHRQSFECVISARIKWKVTASDGSRARAAMLGICLVQGRARMYSGVIGCQSACFLAVTRLCAYRDREVVKIVS